MSVRVVCQEARNQCSDRDYVRVSTTADPNDDTVTLATIERVVEKSVKTIESTPNWHVKTLIINTPMSYNDALGLATCYAERKGIPVVYSQK